jgi:hypothetical protein
VRLKGFQAIRGLRQLSFALSDSESFWSAFLEPHFSSEVYNNVIVQTTNF